MGGRDHSCEVCGRGGFNDPNGRCECAVDPALEERAEKLISTLDDNHYVEFTDRWRDLTAEQQIATAAQWLQARSDEVVVTLNETEATALIDAVSLWEDANGPLDPADAGRHARSKLSTALNREER